MNAPAKYCLRCARPLVARQEPDRVRLACPMPDCGYVFYDNPVPVVAAIVEHEGAIVLVRNKGWPESWFGLVSGFLERGESPEEGIVREVREELGLESAVESLVGVYPFDKLNQLIVAFYLRATGVVTLGEEIAACKRVEPSSLRPWAFGTGLAVRDWLARRAREQRSGD